MKLTKKLGIVSTGVVVGLAGVSLPSGPQGAQLFNFNYSFGGENPVSASGTLTTTDLNGGNNSYTTTGITGTRTYKSVTNNILSLLAPGNFGRNDNLLFASAPFLNGNGFSFRVDGTNNASSSGRVNVFYTSSVYTESSGRIGSGAFNVTNVTTQPVPEPATIAAAVTSGAGLITAGLKQRQKRKVA